ncbi:hypothetical protein CVS40_8138 [Lucilia cuprina]|nr:hypothetical protein CVS40_8138 [Lucilia cuprina]
MVVISASTTLMMTATAATTMVPKSQQIMTTTCSLTDSTIVQTTPSPVPLLASTTISSANVTIRNDKDVCSKEEEKKTAKILPRPAKFIPPPPPPRRLLLTQTNLKTSGQPQKPLRQLPLPPKSGVSADDGSSVGVKDVGDVCDAPTVNISAPPCTATMTKTMMTTTMATTTKTMSTAKPTKIPQPIEDVYNIKKYSAVIACKAETVSPSTKPRHSSTIIETSLLGSVEAGSNRNPLYNSSTTVSTMKEKTTVATTTKKDYKDHQQQQQQQQEEKKDKDLKHKKKQEEHTQQKEDATDKDSKSACVQPAGVGSGLSPRLEMRLALNHDILGDEDLISYDPGPDLTTILGHDLSTFQRRTGRDLLNRSATNRVQPKEAVISFSQQRNSKMDTPTVNRRPRPQINNSTNNTPLNNSNNYNTSSSPASSMPFVGSARVGGVPQHLQPNRNTWSSSVSVDRSRDGSVNDVSSSKNINYNRGDSKLSDLEILARREKIYCMSQLKSGSQVKMGTKMMTTTTASTATMMKSNNFYHNNNPLTRTMSTTSMGAATEDITHTPKMAQRQRKIGRDESALMESGKANKLINFIKRRNSENPSTANNSQTSLNDSNASSTPQHTKIPMSPRKDNDKPSLNRRLWKQITKRRRSNSVSELVAS